MLHAGLLCYSSQNGWEPEENIYSKDLIYEYERKQELEEKRRLAAVKRSLQDPSCSSPAKKIKLGSDVGVCCLYSKLN